MSETKPRSLIDEYLAEKEANGKIRENNVLFVTDLTKECLRNAYYDITIDTPATPKQLRIFASGNMIEEFWVNEVLRNSKEIKILGTQLPVRYIDPIEPFEIHGRIDVLCQHNNNQLILHEVKSIKNFYYLHEAKQDHQLQSGFYLGCLGLEYCDFNYLSKENMLQGLDAVDRTYRVKGDINSYYYVIDSGKILYRSLKDKSPPQKNICWMCDGKNSKGKIFCNYKDVCDGQTKMDTPTS